MTKAEEKALEVYPEQLEHYPERNTEWFDVNETKRAAYQQGYEDATRESYRLQMDAFNRGKERGLMSCPKWKLADKNIFTNTIDFAIRFLNDGGDHEDYYSVVVTNRVMKGEQYLLLSDLDVLLPTRENT